MYDPAHRGVVAIAPEVGVITETTDGVTPHTLPAVPSNPTLIGYTPTMPEASPRLNNRKGYAVGASGALYNAPGSPRPQVRVDLRPGSTGFVVNYCQRDSNDALPYFALFVGIGGVFTDVYRFCKVNELTLNLTEPGDGGGGEIAATATVFGLERQFLATPLVQDETLLRALGVPLMWHDVRGFDVPIVGVPTPLRKALMGVSATLSHNLMYKGGRENFGDNNALSRTAYELLEGHKNARAEITLHQRLNRALFNGAINAQQWGDIDVMINDVAATRAMNMTLVDAIVTDEVLRGVQSGEQQSYSVPVELSDLVLDDTPPVVGP